MIFEYEKELKSQPMELCHEALKFELGLGVQRDNLKAIELYGEAAYQGSKYGEVKARALDPTDPVKIQNFLFDQLDSDLDELLTQERRLTLSPPKRILIIDDAPDLLLIFRKILEKQDYQALTAENGNQAFKQIQNHPNICCVFVDLKMPEMNGFEFLGLVRKMQVLDNVPIVVETAYTNHDLIKAGKRYGVNAWIKKPFHELKVLEVLDKVLG